MRLGGQLMLSTSNPQPGDVAELARSFVGEGFDSLWVGHSIGRNGIMIMDPFVVLAVAASVTNRVELGTAILQLPLYASVVDVAHRILSLNQICGDRLSLGIGAGSSKPDYDAVGQVFEDRFQRMNRNTKILRSLLTLGGTDEVDLNPWPGMKCAPRLLLGSWGAGVIKAADTFDGWIASAAYRKEEEVLDALHRYRAAGGSRAIAATIQVRNTAELEKTRELFDKLSEAGFDDAIVILSADGPSPKEVRALLP